MKIFLKIFIVTICIAVVIGIIYIVGKEQKQEYASTYLFDSKFANTNKIWVGTFQLAWNELAEKLGSKIELETNNSTLVDNLNKHTFTKDMLNENSYYIKTGIIRKELQEEITENLENKFENENSILNRINWDTTGQNYLIYALLNKSFTFETPFEKFEGKFADFEDTIKYFGVGKQTSEDAFEQVQVLFYNSINDFAIKITTKENEEVLLYKTESLKEFEISYNELLQKTNTFTGNTKFEKGKDELKVPFINVNEEINYDELCNKVIKGTGGSIIEQAIQTVKFNMDNYGGNIASEAMIYRTASFSEEQTRTFNFNDTFLLYLKEADKQKPYFALKIDDMEFLVKAE